MGNPIFGTHLASDMAPIMLASKLLKVVLQERAHLDDAVGHTLDFTEPLLVKSGIVQDGGCNACTMDGRVRVKWANKDLDLGVHALLLLCRSTDNREGTNTLTVETLDIKKISLLVSLYNIEGSRWNSPCSWRNSGRGPSHGPSRQSTWQHKHHGLCFH